MPLTKLGRAYLEYEGNAQDRLKAVLDVEVGLNSAVKMNTGINYFLKAEENLQKEGRVIGEMEEIVTTSTGSITTKRMLILSEEESKDPIRVMQIMGYDPLKWKLDWSKIRRNYWDVSMKLRSIIGYDENDKPIYEDVPEKKTNHAFMVEMKISPIQDVLSTEMINKIFGDLPSPDIEDYIYSGGNRGLEFGLVDFHLGSGMSLENEISLFKNTVLSTLGKVNSYNIALEKIWFQVGQDFIHIDTSNSTTTSGTQMNTSRTWSEIVDAAVECLLWSAEQFRRVCPVEYIYIPGNHDKTISYLLAKILEKVYLGSSAVTVDVVDFPRKYRKYGNNAFGLSHGREEGKRIRTKFQEEAADILASTHYREFHLADKHHEEAMEEGEIIYRILPTVTELDGWHISKGFKALRRCTSYLWNPEGGKDILEVVVKV